MVDGDPVENNSPYLQEKLSSLKKNSPALAGEFLFTS
jgi:hypothetical protein